MTDPARERYGEEVSYVDYYWEKLVQAWEICVDIITPDSGPQFPPIERWQDQDPYWPGYVQG